MSSADTIYVAIESFAAEVEGQQYQVRKGIDRVRGAHPLYRQVPQFFAPVEEKVTFDVEQATKEPGEKREASLGKPVLAEEPAVASDAASDEEKPADRPNRTVGRRA